MRLALIPAAPVLLADVDLSEPRLAVEARAAITEILTDSPRWSLPVDALPVLLGLGGYGIDRGLDTRSGELLAGEAWVEAVAGLDETEREVCLDAHRGLVIAALHAYDAGVTVGPRGTSDAVLVPLDLSAAATADAPLAPVDGAQEFDAQVLDAIREADISALRTAVAAAAGVHADLDLLGAVLDDLETSGRTLQAPRILLDDQIHDVRTLCAVIEC